MIGIIIITVTALLLSLLILFVADRFKVENKSDEFDKLLPGYNCGVCGYGTCKGLADAMVDDPQLYQKCKPLRGDALREMEAYLRGNNLI